MGLLVLLLIVSNKQSAGWMYDVPGSRMLAHCCTGRCHASQQRLHRDLCSSTSRQRHIVSLCDPRSRALDGDQAHTYPSRLCCPCDLWLCRDLYGTVRSQRTVLADLAAADRGRDAYANQPNVFQRYRKPCRDTYPRPYLRLQSRVPEARELNQLAKHRNARPRIRVPRALHIRA